ncbi:winged helix-turn-helix transcriptional regulator [Erythrobacter aureus]
MLLIIREAFYGVIRFEDMLADLDIPRAMLSDRLKKLCDAQILEKRPYREPGTRQRMAYFLTAKGQALAAPLISLSQWAEQEVMEKPAPVEFVRRVTGETIRAKLVDANGTVAQPRDITIRLPEQR